MSTSAVAPRTTAEILAPALDRLGTVTDEALGQELSLPTYVVRKAREERGIPKFGSRQRAVRTESGTVSPTAAPGLVEAVPASPGAELEPVAEAPAPESEPRAPKREIVRISAIESVQVEKPPPVANPPVKVKKVARAKPKPEETVTGERATMAAKAHGEAANPAAMAPLDSEPLPPEPGEAVSSKPSKRPRRAATLTKVAGRKPPVTVPKVGALSPAAIAARRPSKLDRHRDIVGVLSDGEVAKRVGMSTEGVRQYRVRHGIDAPNPSPTSPPVSTGTLAPSIEAPVAAAELSSTPPKVEGAPASGPSLPATGRRSSKLDAHRDIVGVLTDSEVARRVGMSAEGVRQYRVRLRIPGVSSAHRTRPKTVNATGTSTPKETSSPETKGSSPLDVHRAIVGVRPDGEVAQIAGVSRSTVMNYKKHKIPAGVGAGGKVLRPAGSAGTSGSGAERSRVSAASLPPRAGGQPATVAAPATSSTPAPRGSPPPVESPALEVRRSRTDSTGVSQRRSASAESVAAPHWAWKLTVAIDGVEVPRYAIAVDAEGACAAARGNGDVLALERVGEAVGYGSAYSSSARAEFAKS